MNCKELVDIALRHLSGWPLYQEDHKVLAREISGGWWLGYQSVQSELHFRYEYFDVNIIRDIFYVLDIGIRKRFRGKGYGAALYKVLEAIAQDCQCKHVQMTPSGWTPSGETRKDYLLKRGYQKYGVEVIKPLATRS